MADKNLKPYAVRVLVKPKAQEGVRYGAKSYKGIALAINKSQAEELAVDVVLRSFANHDGSVTRPIITRQDITVKECNLYGDFSVKPQLP